MRLVARIALMWVLILVSGCRTPQRNGIANEPIAKRNFTFFVLSDVHVGAENLKANPPVTQIQNLEKTKANIEVMKNLVGRPFNASTYLTNPQPDIIAAPRGLFILGDLTDGHKELVRQQEQWRTFDSLFPALGFHFGDLTTPVFACAGNHDGDVAGPTRQGLIARNRQLAGAGHLAAISSNGFHAALNWHGVHLLLLNLCPADATDTETPFKYGKPGAGSWNDPQGALSFLKEYLNRKVSTSGAPVILMFHYGFDGFSMNDWNWWTPKQRRDLYELLKNYNVAALIHGHNHHAEHYQWPSLKNHKADLDFMFGGNTPPNHRQYDILSCGNVCWVISIRGNQLIARHFKGPEWNKDRTGTFVKTLDNQSKKNGVPPSPSQNDK